MDLGIARTRELKEVFGDSLLVESINGEADCYFNDDEVNYIELDKTRKTYMDFWRIFITNTVQTGKTCVILIGRDGVFDGVSDVARQTTLDEVNTTISSIEEKTGKRYVIIPSEDLLVSNDDTEEWNVGGSGSVKKMKEWFMEIDGLFRVKFTLWSSSETGGKARVYKNGVEYGTEYTMTTTPTVRSQDLAFIAGDLCQLYIIDGLPSQSQYVSNFRLYGVHAIGIALETT